MNVVTDLRYFILKSVFKSKIMKYILKTFVAFCTLFLVGCESVSNDDLNPGISDQILEEIETQESLFGFLDQQKKGYWEGSVKDGIVKKYLQLGGEWNLLEDSGRYPLCSTNGVFYPNGNDTSPCLVRHKITFLDDYYERYEDEITIFIYFEFDIQSCHELSFYIFYYSILRLKLGIILNFLIEYFVYQISLQFFHFQNSYLTMYNLNQFEQQELR